MNAGQEFSARMNLRVYKTINDIIDADYDTWIKMTNEELIVIVMRRMEGRVSPTQLRTVIGEL